jgi:hypothetical protein
LNRAGLAAEVSGEPAPSGRPHDEKVFR